MTASLMTQNENSQQIKAVVKPEYKIRFWEVVPNRSKKINRTLLYMELKKEYKFNLS